MSEKELYRRLGRAIATRRNELQLTQDQVALKLGLSRASLANLENGRQRIMVHQLFRLVDALKLKSILDLLPASWMFESKMPEIAVHGTALNAKEHSAVQNLIASALFEERLRKRTA